MPTRALAPATLGPVPALTHFDRHIGDETHTPDHAVAALAGEQHGVVAYRQLALSGLGKDAIQHRVRSGRLHRVHRGVYAVGHPRLTAHGRWTAAVLACTPGSVLSHRGAAALHGLLRYSGARIDVTATGGRPRADIVVHRVSRLEDDERQLVEGIPVTSVARTLIDLSSVVRLDLLDRAIAEAERRDVFDLRALQRLMTPGRRGVTPLREALLRYHDPGFTRSEFERRFARLCRDGGLPPPAMNLWICGQEVDAAWEDAKVAVLLDSWEFHRTRAAFEDDRRRQAALQVRGYRVLPITDRRFVDDPGTRVLPVTRRAALARRP